ncbi:hypothetical protein [Halomarina litorea]|uniref:hypothetical protein n=1 Tax=Halomarina litorea TaxID=2961595 RepID=UPI0020C4AACE|nr:hypothetical protein [Halomarina sp. BCD28]
MSLDDLSQEVQDAYGDLGEDLSVELDRETRNELAFLTTVLGADADDILGRALHQFFQGTVETGRVDFHLRRGYDVTYDEYLSGMTYEQMTGQPDPPDNDGRRYQF